MKLYHSQWLFPSFETIVLDFSRLISYGLFVAFFSKHDKKDSILVGDYHNRCWDQCDGTLPWGREIGLNTEYSLGEWGFTAMGQGGRQQMENYWGNIRGQGILAKLT